MTVQEQKDIDTDAADAGTGAIKSVADVPGACGRGVRLGIMICVREVFDDGSARSAPLHLARHIRGRVAARPLPTGQTTLRPPNAVGGRSAIRRPAGRSATAEPG